MHLTVIEGNSVPALNSKAVTEGMAAFTVATIADVANVVVPG